MIKVNIIKAINYNNEQLEKLNAAVAKIEAVLNSESFRQKVLEYETDGKRTFSFRKNLFSSFPSYTNEQVYSLIMQAREEDGNVADGIIDLYLELLQGDGNGTIGYGNPGSETIYTYEVSYNSADANRIAGHLIHEWCHKIGFEHAKYRWMDRNRSHSVPYGIGKLVEKLAQVNEQEPDSTDDHFAMLELYGESSTESFLEGINKSTNWRVAACLDQLAKQVNILAPTRNRKSDGTIGDKIHEKHKSDHNPWVKDPSSNTGVVTAMDITHHPGMCDCNILADSLIKSRDKRIKYLIWNKRIANSQSMNGKQPWEWRPYGGKNPHDHHLHISVKESKDLYNSTLSWNIRINSSMPVTS